MRHYGDFNLDTQALIENVECRGLFIVKFKMVIDLSFVVLAGKLWWAVGCFFGFVWLEWLMTGCVMKYCCNLLYHTGVKKLTPPKVSFVTLF